MSAAAPAHLITVGLEPGLNASIRAWFHQFNFLPPLPLTAAKIDTLSLADANFIKLFEVMAASPFNNFILIIHGAPNGFSLFMKLHPRQIRAPDQGTSHLDVQRILDLAEGGPELSPADQKKIGLTQAQSLELREAMLKMDFKTVDSIEFRSCNLGRNLLSLDRFRRFCGARLAGAPNLHSVFGHNTPLLSPDFRRLHEHFHSGPHWETYKFPYAYREPDLVCCFELNNLSKPESAGHVAAASADTINSWVRQYLAPNGTYTKGDLAFHALWIADEETTVQLKPEQLVPGTKPDAKRLVPVQIEIDDEDRNSPLGDWGGPPLRRMVLPLSSLYKQHIVYAQ